jgi:hypothetical protein
MDILLDRIPLIAGGVYTSGDCTDAKMMFEGAKLRAEDNSHVCR